jgi:Kef-type K+ transport system membrane component KefB
MSHILQLLLILCVILLASKYAGALSTRIGQPMVLGEIALGLLLGPTILDIINWHIGGFYIFGGVPHEALHGAAQAVAAVGAPLGGWTGEAVMHTLRDLAEIGVILLMFMAGLETDLHAVLKVGRVAFWAAIGGVIAPMASAFLATELFARAGLHFSIYEALFIGTVLTATSVSISAQTLMELGRLRSKEGSTILGAAVIDDVIGIIVLSFVIAFKPASAGATSGAPEHLLDWIMLGLRGTGLGPEALAYVRIAILILMLAAFFLLAIKADRWLIRPALMRFERLPVTEGLLAGTLLIGCLYAWGAEWIGNVAAITGSYTAGVLISQHTIKRQVTEKLHTLTYSFFVPVFFISIGMEANARPIFAPLAHIAAMKPEQWLMFWFTLTIVALAVLAKVLGCLAGAKLTGFTWNESYKVGVGMISRGEVGIIVALVGLNAKIIDRDVFSIMILMVLVTTLITPIWLKAVFRREKNGNSNSAPAEAQA